MANGQTTPAGRTLCCGDRTGGKTIKPTSRVLLAIVGLFLATSISANNADRKICTVENYTCLHGQTGVYHGECRDGEPHGDGEVTYHTGARYEGDFADGHAHGKGRLFHTDGSLQYHGEIREDEKNGEGLLIAEDGTRFEGTFKDDHFQRGSVRLTSGLTCRYRDNEIVKASCKMFLYLDNPRN